MKDFIWIPPLAIFVAVSAFWLASPVPAAGISREQVPCCGPSPAPPSVRPYLTEEIERVAARDHCVLRRQICDERGVCVSCFGCGNGLKYLGTAETKCSGPSSCVRLETNEDWEREGVDLGLCER